MPGKKKTLLLTLYLLLPLFLSADLKPISYHISEDLHRFSDNYPRLENSSAEKRTISYISDTLEGLEVDYRRTALSEFQDFHSFSSLIEAYFPGEQNTSGQLVLLFPLNHPPDAGRQDSGAYGLTLAMTLCRSLAAAPPPIDVSIVFAGAEFRREEPRQLGSRAYLADRDALEHGTVLYSWFPNPPGELRLEPYGTGILTPAWLLERSVNSLATTETSFSLSTIDQNLHHLALNDEETRIDVFLRQEIPALLIRGVSSDQSEVLEVEELSRFYLRFIEDFPADPPSYWDGHYLFFQLAGENIILPEIVYVMTILLLFGLVLLYPFFQQKRFLRYTRSLKKNSWVLPLIFVLMFGYLLLATFLLEWVSRIGEKPDLWVQHPFAMLLLKVGLSTFLFSLSHQITRPLHLSRLRGSFYSSSALVFLLVNTTILTSFNISLTVYGALLFLLGFLFSVARHRMAKLTALLLSIAAMLFLLFQVIHAGSARTIHAILLSHLWGNLLIAFHLLPFMLFTLRLRLLFHSPSRRRANRFALFFDIGTGLLSTALAVYFIFSPFAFERRDRYIQLRERIAVVEGEHRIDFSGSNSEQEHSYRDLYGKEHPIDLSGQFTPLLLSPDKNFMPYSMIQDRFLGRISYRLSLSPLYAPEKIELSLVSEGGIALYDSNFPYSLSTDRRRAIFHIGSFPPVPLQIEFTLPQGLEPHLQLRAVYYRPPYETDIGIDDYRMTITDTIDLTEGD